MRSSRSCRPLSSIRKEVDGLESCKALSSCNLPSLEVHSTTVPLATRPLNSHPNVKIGNRGVVPSSSSECIVSPTSYKQNEVLTEIGVSSDDGASTSVNLQLNNTEVSQYLASLPGHSLNSTNLGKCRKSNSDFQVSDFSEIAQDKNVKGGPKLAAVFTRGRAIGISTSNEVGNYSDSHDEGCEMLVKKLEKSKVGSDYSHHPVRPIVPILQLGGSVAQRNVTASIKIQRWFRQKMTEKRRILKQSSMLSTEICGDCNSQDLRLDEVKGLLQEKKSDYNKSRKREMDEIGSDLIAHNRKVAERQQKRQEKLTAERKKAIDNMQKKRDHIKKKNAKLAQEEEVQIEGKRKAVKVKKKSKLSAASNCLTSHHLPTKSVESVNVSTHRGIQCNRSGSPHGQSKFSDKSPTVSTYEEIMDKLQLLEEAPSLLSPKHAQSTESKDVSINGDKFKLNKSGSKLQSILFYLDEVEKAEADRSQDLTKSVSDPSKDEDLERKKKISSNISSLEAASATVNDVTTTIMAQRMEIDSKSKTIEMLQKALNQQKELTIYHAKEAEKEGRRRFDLQKVEYEATIKRHQCFIDQLIDDKRMLSERCENLVNEIKDLDKKCKAKLASVEESHATEINKIKQISSAADKLRKEKWQAEEARRIKEATVKGLEPEIQRIIARGKSEIQKLKALHDAELTQADERASRKFVSQMEELREQCAIEREQACTHEREIARQRYEKLLEQEEVNFQQQRRRLFTELAQEKEKIAEEVQRQKFNFELRLKDSNEIHNRMMEELKISHAKQLEELSFCHKSEIRSVEDRVEAEHKRWEESQKQKTKGDIIAKEREMRRQLKEERDKDIEMVISKLEEEMAEAKHKCDRMAEARIRRIKEKCEAEVREVERSEKSTIEKFNTMKTKLVELEGETTRLQTLLHQRNKEIERVGQIASKLTQERDRVSDVVRQEFFDRLVSTEEENKELKKEMCEQRSRHKLEIERVRKSKDLELAEVHDRVKQALDKKESNLEVLREQYEGAIKRTDHLQMLLQKQRNELLKK